MESVNQMSEYVNKGLNFVNQNKILSSVLGMLLVLYAAAAAPKLPKSVVKIFDNSLFKLGYMFLIAYIATKNPSVAIITAVALLVTIQTLSSREAAESAVKGAEAESISKSKAIGEAQMKQIAQERAAARQEAISEIKIVTEQSKPVAIKESAGENDVRIPLSPARAEFIEASTKKAEAHYGAASKAQTEGNVALAEAHKQEAVKQEIKIEAAIVAKQHIIAAEQAKSAGNIGLAQAHIQEAAKQEAKAEALVKSEAHAIAAEEALARGAVDEAQAHKAESAKQEAKAEALVKSEAHAVAAEEALARGAVDETQAHKAESAKQEAKAIAMVKAEAEMVRSKVQPERVVVENEVTGVPSAHTDVEHAPVLAPESPATTTQVVSVPVTTGCSTPYNVEGYSGNEYADL